jgi:hypothetical protein
LTSGVGKDKKQNHICGALWPFTKNSSLHEIISRSKANEAPVSPKEKAKWCYQPDYGEFLTWKADNPESLEKAQRTFVSEGQWVRFCRNICGRAALTGTLKPTKRSSTGAITLHP